MIHLVVKAGVVINRVNGARPTGLPASRYVWVAAEDEREDVQIGWLRQQDGSFVKPVVPEIEPDPEAVEP